jgi:hypothetical protein
MDSLTQQTKSDHKARIQQLMDKMPAEKLLSLYHFAAYLSELDEEDVWQQTFYNTRPTLERMAEQAVEEYRAGKTEPLDLATL